MAFMRLACSVLLCLFLTAASADTLRNVAPAGFYIGTAVGHNEITNDTQYATVAGQEFNQITAENAFKMKVIQPSEGVFDWVKADEIRSFAQANNQRLWGHTLVWAVDSAIPQWVLDKESTITRPEAIALMTNHITQVCHRYAGLVAVWDVVNEPIEPSFDPNNTNQLRDNFWLRTIGTDYIQIAFNAAKAADPNALLYLNEYNAEYYSPKADKLHTVLDDLINNHNLPIDGVGFQFHEDINEPIPVRQIKPNFQRFADLGLKIAITELDIKTRDPQTEMAGWAKRESQGNYVYQLAGACLEQPACDTLTVWVMADHYGWLPNEEAGLFSSTWVAKPYYWAINNLLSDVQFLIQ